MQLAIHQPEFMPWTGFFHKMALADRYVVFDHVQFKKRYFENRNIVVTAEGQRLYVGVPVQSKGRFQQAICDVKIDNSQRWKDKLLGKIEHIYKKAPFFEMFFFELKRLITERDYAMLKELNLALIDFFRKHLEIRTPCSCSSDLGVENFKASDLILQICLRHKADVYLCGASGQDYLKMDDFRSHGIEVRFLNYQPPQYGQLCRGFVSHASTLDLLFNQGKKSRDILLNAPTDR